MMTQPMEPALRILFGLRALPILLLATVTCSPRSGTFNVSDAAVDVAVDAGPTTMTATLDGQPICAGGWDMDLYPPRASLGTSGPSNGYFGVTAGCIESSQASGVSCTFAGDGAPVSSNATNPLPLLMHCPNGIEGTSTVPSGSLTVTGTKGTRRVAGTCTCTEVMKNNGSTHTVAVKFDMPLTGG